MMKSENSRYLPKVSVVLINFNYGNFISDAIDSVLEQDYPNIEVILIDDGSTDCSKEIIDKYSESLDTIVVFKSSKGPSRCRNAGIQAATGDFITFLDSDDCWLSSKVSREIGYLLANSLDGVYCTAMLFGANLSNPVNTVKPDISFQTFEKKPLGVGGYFMSTLLVSKNVFRVIGEFDERLTHGEDYDFCARLFYSFRIECLNTSLVKIRLHRDSLSSKFIPRFFSDLNIWAENFLRNFGQKLSTLRRIKYLSKVLVGQVKIIFRYRQYRFFFFCIKKWISLSRYI